MGWESVDLDSFDRAGRYKLLTGSVIPRPIAWVTTAMPDGRTNLAPYSQFIIISADPGLLGFSIGSRAPTAKDTLEHLRREREMVINTAPPDCAELIQDTSRDFALEVSETEHFDIETVPSVKVKPPRLARSAIQFECTVEQLIPLGGSVLVVGLVRLMHIAEGLRDSANHIDHRLYQPLSRIGGRRYARVGEIIDV
jgi:flavin reductase (DIM6/NTAB) family NADH-FMN oxidoreductase RutF